MTTPPLAPPPRPGEGPPAGITGGYGTHPAWPHVAPAAPRPGYPARPERHEPLRWPQGDLEWIMAMSQIPCDVIPINAALGGGICETGQLILFGGSLVNSGTVASTATLRDGMDLSGNFISQLTVPASGNANFEFPASGVLIEIGAFLGYAGGLLSGALYVAHLWKYPFTPPGE